MNLTSWHQVQLLKFKLLINYSPRHFLFNLTFSKLKDFFFFFPQNRHSTPIFFLPRLLFNLFFKMDYCTVLWISKECDCQRYKCRAISFWHIIGPSLEGVIDFWTWWMSVSVGWGLFITEDYEQILVEWDKSWICLSRHIYPMINVFLGLHRTKEYLFTSWVQLYV